MRPPPIPSMTLRMENHHQPSLTADLIALHRALTSVLDAWNLCETKSNQQPTQHGRTDNDPLHP